MGYMTNRTRPLSAEERDKVEKNLGLIGDVIERTFRHIIKPTGAVGEGFITKADLFSAGQFGLIEALERWTPEKGAFSTYAEWWIMNKIYRWLRDFGFRIKIPKQLLTRLPAQRGDDYKPDAEDAKLDKIRNFKSINEALDKAHKDDSPARNKMKSALIRVIYSVKVTTPIEKLGRMIFLKMAGLDGGTYMPMSSHRTHAAEMRAMMSSRDAFISIGHAIGVTGASAKRAFAVFLAAAQAAIHARGIEWEDLDL